MTDEDAIVLRDGIAAKLKTIPSAVLVRLVTSEPAEQVCVRCKVVLYDEHHNNIGELTITIVHTENAAPVEHPGVPADQYERGGQN